jgi:hypothetical protein
VLDTYSLERGLLLFAGDPVTDSVGCPPPLSVPDGPGEPDVGDPEGPGDWGEPDCGEPDCGDPDCGGPDWAELPVGGGGDCGG